MSSTSPKLNVAIVGGGLAGALAARVLREDHNVTIYERSRTATEVGAAINIGPNGVRILDTLGFDRVKAGSLPVAAMRIFDTQGNKKLEQFPEYAKTYGSDWLFHHRADLRTEFLRLATSDAGDVKGDPAKIRWDCQVVDLDTDEGKITLSTGEVITADLVVAADGIKSIIRPLVVGDAAYETAKPSGLSAFRVTMETKYIQEKLGYLPEILDKSKPVSISMFYSFDPTKRSIVEYPCRNFELLNFVCICRDDTLGHATSESWSAPGDRDELLKIFSDFPAHVLDILALGENIKLWQLRDQDPLPSYIKGRTVLVGDAAHAMTPHQGQGGTQAVEDAEGFRLFLAPGVTRESVPQLLKDFDSVRRPRASQIQQHTKNAQSKRSAEEVLKYERYNWTYPGVVEGLARVQAGQPVVAI